MSGGRQAALGRWGGVISFIEHQPLREVGWFKTGGAADWFYRATTLDGLTEALKAAHIQELPFQVIGEGSHSLISDSGFPGLVIQNQTNTIFFMHDRSQVIVDAGTPLRQLVTQTVSAGYSGLEFLSEMPGTIGGAVYHNVTQFGHQVGEYVRGATLIFPEEKEAMHHVDRDWFNFTWHTSRLKNLRRTRQPVPIILTVTLQLSKMDHASCVKKLQSFHELRRSFPHPTQPCLQVFDQLLGGVETNISRGPTQPKYLLDKNVLRNLKMGEIQIFNSNPNFVVNLGLGSSHDAALLIAQIEDIVEERYRVRLKPQIEFVGYWSDSDLTNETPLSSLKRDGTDTLVSE